MTTYKLQIQLLSDTTFGRGDGVAGLVDQEVEHDSYGFPYLRGRTLKGLIREECDNVVAASPELHRSPWQQRADDLFGRPGSTLDTMAMVHFGDACLPQDVRQAVAYQIKRERLDRAEILESLTTIRRQTAISSEGVAQTGSLRSSRVILRDLIFTADLNLIDHSDASLSLLMVGAKALRYLGSRRNRGCGHVRCTLSDSNNEPLPTTYLDSFFAQEV